MTIVTAGIIWAVLVAVAGVLAARKDRNVAGWAIGALLLPLVILVLLALPPAGRKCPACAETVRSDATVCRYCHAELPEIEDVPEQQVDLLPFWGFAMAMIVAAVVVWWAV